MKEFSQQGSKIYCQKSIKLLANLGGISVQELRLSLFPSNKKCNEKQVAENYFQFTRHLKLKENFSTKKLQMISCMQPVMIDQSEDS